MKTEDDYKNKIRLCSLGILHAIADMTRIKDRIDADTCKLGSLYEAMERHNMSMEDDSLYTQFIASDGTLRLHANDLEYFTEHCDIVRGALNWANTFNPALRTSVISVWPASVRSLRFMLELLKTTGYGRIPLSVPLDEVSKLHRVLIDADFMGCPAVVTQVRACLKHLVLTSNLPDHMWWSDIPVLWTHMCTVLVPSPIESEIFGDKLQTIFDQALVRDTDECLQLCKSPWLRSTPSFHLDLFMSACDSPLQRPSIIRELFPLIPKLALDVLFSKPAHHDLAKELLPTYSFTASEEDGGLVFLKTALSTGAATVPLVHALLSAGCSPWVPENTLVHCIPVLAHDVACAVFEAAAENSGVDSVDTTELELYHCADIGARQPHLWQPLLQLFTDIKCLTRSQRSSIRIHFANECLGFLRTVNALVIDGVLSALTPEECNAVFSSIMAGNSFVSGASFLLPTTINNLILDVASEFMQYMHEQRQDMAGTCTHAKQMLQVSMRANRLLHPDRDDLGACLHLATRPLSLSALKYAASHCTMRTLYVVLSTFKPSSAHVSAAAMHVMKMAACTYQDAWRMTALLQASSGVLSHTAKARKSLFYRLLVYDEFNILTDSICRAFYRDKQLYDRGMPPAAIELLAPIIGGLNGGCMPLRVAHRYCRLIIGHNDLSAYTMCKLGGVPSSSEWLVRLCIRRGAQLDDGMLRAAVLAADVDIAEYIIREGGLTISPETFCLALKSVDQLPMADMLHSFYSELLHSPVVQTHFNTQDTFIPYVFTTFLLRK